MSPAVPTKQNKKSTDQLAASRADSCEFYLNVDGGRGVVVGVKGTRVLGGFSCRDGSDAVRPADRQQRTSARVCRVLTLSDKSASKLG